MQAFVLLSIVESACITYGLRRYVENRLVYLHATGFIPTQPTQSPPFYHQQHNKKNIYTNCQTNFNEPTSYSSPCTVQHVTCAKKQTNNSRKNNLRLMIVFILYQGLNFSAVCWSYVVLPWIPDVVKFRGGSATEGRRRRATCF